MAKDPTKNPESATAQPALEKATEQGYIGSVPDQAPRSAYTNPAAGGQAAEPVAAEPKGEGTEEQNPGD